VCFGAIGEGILKVSLQGGNVQLPNFLLRRYVARLLFCVTSHSFSFVNALNFV
jgi:hypothetical protein